LLKGRETRRRDRLPVTRLFLLEQPVADQKLDAAFTNFDRRNHDNASGAALAEASCADSGCWFFCHLSL
jgi:hypothetical protein